MSMKALSLLPCNPLHLPLLHLLWVQGGRGELCCKLSGHVEWVAFLGVIVVIELGCESGGEDVCANGVVGIVAIVNNRDCM